MITIELRVLDTQLLELRFGREDAEETSEDTATAYWSGWQPGRWASLDDDHDQDDEDGVDWDELERAFEEFDGDEDARIYHAGDGVELRVWQTAGGELVKARLLWPDGEAPEACAAPELEDELVVRAYRGDDAAAAELADALWAIISEQDTKAD